MNDVTLRSREVLKDLTPVQKDVEPEKESGEQLKNDDDKKNKGKKVAEKKKKEENSRREEPEESKHMPALPFPQNLYREKMDKSTLTNASLCQILEGDPDKEEKNRGDLSGQAHRALQRGTINFDKSLCDSGASINLMPLSIYRKLENEIGEIRSTPISLQLADQTTLITKGIVEDVLVRMDNFVFPVDFIVLKMEENKEVPLILGRPFLTSGRAVLDIHERKLMLQVGEEPVTFNIDVETGTQKEKPAASIEWKVKNSKEKAVVSEKDKCMMYPKKVEKKLSAWICALVWA
uniref:Uncharacterized protein LOC104219988 n=1 Tax=Nicotiana sylvestris TaxID=4096 RepID=A0A1U7VRP9_NICSY|nr:PREDICTED: uncharacterized protein LOC104219988 [Nicotiana sylvestris]